MVIITSILKKVTNSCSKEKQIAVTL